MANAVAASVEGAYIIDYRTCANEVTGDRSTGRIDGGSLRLRLRLRLLQLLGLFGRICAFVILRRV